MALYLTREEDSEAGLSILIDTSIFLSSTKKGGKVPMFERSSITIRDNKDKILLNIEMNDC